MFAVPAPVGVTETVMLPGDVVDWLTVQTDVLDDVTVYAPS
jgi:hypothetical protein